MVPHCKCEGAVLNALNRKYGAHDVLACAQGLNVGYPVSFDPEFLVAQKYLKTGFPTIAIIDRNKTVTYMDSGEIPKRASMPQ